MKMAQLKLKRKKEEQLRFLYSFVFRRSQRNEKGNKRRHQSEKNMENCGAANIF